MQGSRLDHGWVLNETLQWDQRQYHLGRPIILNKGSRHLAATCRGCRQLKQIGLDSDEALATGDYVSDFEALNPDKEGEANRQPQQVGFRLP